MSKERFSALAVVIVLFLTQSTKYSFGDNVFCGKAREFRLIAADTALAGRVIASYEVASQAECLFHCYENKRCHSYNYRFTLHNTGNLGLCEINQETFKSCPLKKTRKEGHGYFEEINVENQRQPYGSETNPGMSCLDINGCQDNDGEWWVSSEETSWSAVKAFCYMNTLEDANVTNLAKNKPAVQSSTGHAWGSAEKAVDGNTNSVFGVHKSCTHTSSTMSPWWRVDLQSVFFIRKLIITNRSDCCSERLSNFQIKIGLSLDDNGNSNPSCGGNHSLKAETKTIVCPKPMIGRYVNIIIPGPGKILTLCEVEVYP